MPKDNEWEQILESDGLLPSDLELLEHDEAGIEAECKYQRELDHIIANDKFSVDDPCFEQRTSHRRSAVYAHDKLKVAIGAAPDDGEFIPPSDAEYMPAPKGATDFAVQTTKRRRPKRGVPSSTITSGSGGHTMATIWDGIKL